MKSMLRVLGYSLLHSLVCSQRSLIRLLHTARFSRALRCAHLFACSLTRSGAHGKKDLRKEGLTDKPFERNARTHLNTLDLRAFVVNIQCLYWWLHDYICFVNDSCIRYSVENEDILLYQDWHLWILLGGVSGPIEGPWQSDFSAHLTKKDHIPKCEISKYVVDKVSLHKSFYQVG